MDKPDRDGMNGTNTRREEMKKKIFK